MAWWLAGERDQHPGAGDFIKRFDPRFWTVNFPRPMMAAVTTVGADALRVDCAFYRAGDLAGLIWESADHHDHPLLRYRENRDYRRCVLRFRWRSVGLTGLDAVGGPTLTIEGRDAGGTARNWYVRLWNYAVGVADDAVVTLDFAALAEGFAPGGAAVFAGDIDRMFVSLTPVGYVEGDETALAARVDATVWVEDISCDGAGSTLRIGDTFVPPHRLRIAGGYDDSYNLTPARILRNMVQLGYREVIDHYVGMSHFFEVVWDAGAGKFLATGGLNEPARAWHVDFLTRAEVLGYRVILSISFELFDANAPEGWKQRKEGGAPAATGYLPPSTLLSPVNAAAMGWVTDALIEFCGLGPGAVHVQIGEPWWWVGPDKVACIYDAATVAGYLAETGLVAPAGIGDVRAAMSAGQLAYLDWLGGKLGAATLALRDAVKAAYPAATVALLFYAPQVLDAAAPALARLNLPGAWAFPAFDVLQLEDYDFVTAGDSGGSARAVAVASEALGYPLASQHYFSGFASSAGDAVQWARIAAAADTGFGRGVAETFVWAFPQVARDGFTWFDIAGDEAVQAFHDVRFPVEVGLGASGGPAFSTVIATTASGHEQRNMQWADARMSFDAGLGVRSEADLGAVVAFFRARRGAAAGFRFRDPGEDSSSGMTGVPGPGDQVLGVGDGVQTRFELVKRYGDGADAQVRRITRPEGGTVRVAVGGVEVVAGWTVAAFGVVEFDVAPVVGAEVTAGFRFDVPVRFAEDRLDVSLATFRAGELPSVGLVEVREG